MKVILFGATGMIGQGTLRECLLDESVTEVLAIGRRAGAEKHAKLREVVVPDPSDLGAIDVDLSVYDACFFCLGVSSAGMNEAAYRAITFDMVVKVAGVLVQKNAGMTFIYVSGAGTDSSAKGSSMWARVKGETENALLAMPFARVVMFRPGYIQPLHGIRSSTTLYRVIYGVLGPVYPLLKKIPKMVTSSDRLGRAMLMVAKNGAPKAILESIDINELAAVSSTPSAAADRAPAP